MAYTQEQLTTLERAIAEGALEVWYGDKKVKYRSLDEMIRIRDIIREDLGLTSAGSRRKVAQFNRGFYPDTE